MATGKVEANIVAQDSGTDWLGVDNKNFNISVSGTFVGTVHLQRRFGEGDAPKDVTQAGSPLEITAPYESIGENPEVGVQYRLFVKTGNYTSGTINLRLSY